MKQLKTLLLATVVCLGTISFSQAQSKVAHINVQELISAMPEMKNVQSELETLSKTLQTSIQDMVVELQNKTNQYEAEAPTKTQEENNKRGQELQTMEQNIMQYRDNAGQEFQQKQQDLMKPITEKARTAILKVSRAQGFDYVLDSSSGVTILADGKNLLDDVKKELGI